MLPEPSRLDAEAPARGERAKQARRKLYAVGKLLIAILRSSTPLLSLEPRAPERTLVCKASDCYLFDRK